MIPIRVLYRITLLSLMATGCTGLSERQASFADAPPPPGITEVETGNLQAIPGFSGGRLGAEITSISVVPDEDIQAIDITVPFPVERVDRIEVISITGDPIQQDRQAQILQDREPNKVGIRLYLPKRKNWEFRLRLIDEPDID